MSVSQLSPYNYSAIVNVVDLEGNLIEHEHLDIRPRLVRVKHSDNMQYVVKPADNWSRISWKTLGNGRFYWIIADYSGVVDPFKALKKEETIEYVTQLSGSNLNPGTYTQISVVRSKRLSRGMVLRIEDINVVNRLSYDVVVRSVEGTTVYLDTGFTIPNPKILAVSTSRVSIVDTKSISLIIPSPNRAFFEALDFGNSLNVLSE